MINQNCPERNRKHCTFRDTINLSDVEAAIGKMYRIHNDLTLPYDEKFGLIKQVVDSDIIRYFLTYSLLTLAFYDDARWKKLFSLYAIVKDNYSDIYWEPLFEPLDSREIYDKIEAVMKPK